ncbi:hypothetical protein B566_EDAN017557 [Ephemera danica]|nr:hypothetical protein B566_EDAN017557 [Ephemera danica]
MKDVKKKGVLSAWLSTIQASILCINETWLHHDIVTSEVIDESQYVVFRKDRTGKRGGGVLFAGQFKKYSKAAASWVLKNRYEPKSSAWRDDIMSKIEFLANNPTKIPDTSEIDKVLFPFQAPKNIAPTECGSIDELSRARVAIQEMNRNYCTGTTPFLHIGARPQFLPSTLVPEVDAPSAFLCQFPKTRKKNFVHLPNPKVCSSLQQAGNAEDSEGDTETGRSQNHGASLQLLPERQVEDITINTQTYIQSEREEKNETTRSEVDHSARDTSENVLKLEQQDASEPDEEAVSSSH